MTDALEHDVLAPHPIDLVHELREALGWPVVAMPISPKEAWEQAVAEVERIRRLLLDFPTDEQVEAAWRHGSNLDFDYEANRNERTGSYLHALHLLEAVRQTMIGDG